MVTPITISPPSEAANICTHDLEAYTADHLSIMFSPCPASTLSSVTYLC